MAEEKSKTITVKEFRYWLEGVEEMQDSAWVPNPVQWRRIRDKINDIEEVHQSPQPIAITAATHPTAMAMGNEGTVRYATPGLVAEPASNNVPGPYPMPTRMAAPPANGVLFANADTPQSPVRTPSIDTSNGTYNSSFA